MGKAGCSSKSLSRNQSFCIRIRKHLWYKLLIHMSEVSDESREEINRLGNERVKDSKSFDLCIQSLLYV